MLGRDIEQLEIVNIKLDIRPFVHLEAHIAKRPQNVACGLRYHMQVPGPVGPSGQGDIHRFGLKACLLLVRDDTLLRFGVSFLKLNFGRVDGLPGSGSLFGSKCPHASEEGSKPALLAQVFPVPFFQRFTVFHPGQCCQGFPPGLFDLFNLKLA